MSTSLESLRALFLAATPVTTCYDGEGEGAGEGAGAGAADDGEPVLVPQDKVNTLLAEERRKAEVKAKVQFQKLEQQLKELQESKTATEAEKEQAIAQIREEIAAQFRSKEETVRLQAQKTEQEWKARYETRDKEAKEATDKYVSTVIDYELQRAVSDSDAVKSKSVIEILRPRTKFIDPIDEKTGKPTGQGPRPMVTLEEVNEAGEQITTLRTPSEAIKRMREMEDYAHLFKSGAASGLGGNSSSGGAGGAGGKIDPRKLTSEEYAKLRKEKPELLGLKPRR